MSEPKRGARSAGVRLGAAAAAWVLAGLLVGGCAGPRGPGAGSDATGTETVWRSRDQYVRVEPRDDAGGAPAVPNDHPAELSPAELGAFLGGLRVRRESSGEAAALFTPAQLEVLSRELLEAFRRAGPGQDVTFAVLGVKRVLWGLGRTPAVTAGRVFVQGGGLNLILGDVHRAVDEYSGRPVEPFVPGSRRASRPGGWAFSLDGAAAQTQGIALVRSDWVRADLAPSAVAPEPVSPRPAAPASPSAPQPPPAPGSPVPGAAPPSSSPAAERKAEPTGEAVAPLGAARAREGLEAVEQRLWVLEELLRKGLVTPGEYRATRARILEEL